MDKNSKLERFQTAFNYLYNRGEFHSKTECAKRLGRSRENVSGAYYGREPFFNDKFLAAFCREFPDINYQWLVEGTGEMIKKNEPKTKDTLIEVYASFIRHIDELRVDLANELNAVRQERAQLHQERENLRALMQQMFDRMGHPSVDYEPAEPHHRLVAESSTNSTENNPVSPQNEPKTTN